jgi:hypothetical protein
VRGEGEGEGGRGENLLADADVLLADEHASVVDALGEGVRMEMRRRRMRVMAAATLLGKLRGRGGGALAWPFFRTRVCRRRSMKSFTCVKMVRDAGGGVGAVGGGGGDRGEGGVKGRW